MHVGTSAGAGVVGQVPADDISTNGLGKAVGEESHGTMVSELTDGEAQRRSEG